MQILVEHDGDVILEPDIQSLSDNLMPLATDGFIDIAEIIYDYLISYTPVGASGELMNQTVIEYDGLNFDIYSQAPQWDWVVGGVPHEWTICPVNAKSLYWPELGHPLPIGRCVIHPEMIANDYPSLALIDSMPAVEARLDDMQKDMIGGE